MIYTTSEQLKELRNDCQVNTQCVSGFITSIWNEGSYDKIADYLHDHFIDHSMPYGFLQNKVGLLRYLKEMTSRITHYTTILELDTIDDFVLCKIRITIASRSDKTNKNQEIIEGYRLFKMQENKIAAHWEMI